MYRSLPNQLTLLRLVLAAVFFLILNLYKYPDGPQWAILLAFGLFILAALTDWLDGYLARKWQVESTFGRIMDPFCDKVLVLGALVYLSGRRFVDPVAIANHEFLTMASGVYPWMVTLMLARELLVTGIRGEMESTGVKFGANLFGKLKMIFQSVGIPVIIFIIWYDPRREGHRWLSAGPDIIAYLMVGVTVLSGIPYVFSAYEALRDPKK